MTELPKATMGRLLKKAGATRVSEDAKIELTRVLEEIGEQIGRDAEKMCRTESGRKTVKAEDIKLAINSE